VNPGPCPDPSVLAASGATAHAAPALEAHGVRAVLLLAGRVGRYALAEGIARPVVDLPVDGRRTILDVWADLPALRSVALPRRVDVRLVVDRTAALPRVRGSSPLAVVRDPAEYRGTAGLVRDLTAQYDDDDRVLVAPANQIPREAFGNVIEALARHDEAVCVVPHADGEFAAAFLLRCGRLRDVPDVGFVDLKEQAIPAARGRPSLRVVRRPAGATFPVRTLAQYVQALRALHAPVRSAAAPDADPFAETWRPAFSLVEAGATVSEGAVLHDAVVLAGARVEDGAVVAQSVVCPGAVVRRGSRVLETVVTG
jgi:hypothetical protein